MRSVRGRSPVSDEEEEELARILPIEGMMILVASRWDGTGEGRRERKVRWERGRAALREMADRGREEMRRMPWEKGIAGRMMQFISIEGGGTARKKE